MGDGLETAAWIAALSGSAVFLIKTVLMLAGGDGHDHDAGFDSGDVDTSGLDMHPGDVGDVHDGDASHPGGSTLAFNLLSIQSAAIFAMGAGWMALACLKSFEMDATGSIFIACAFGFALVYMAGKLLLKARGLESTGTLDLHNAVGHTGTVYLGIPEGGQGQVQVEVQGRLVTAGARSSSGGLATGMRVRVESVDGAGVLEVAPVS